MSVLFKLNDLSKENLSFIVKNLSFQEYDENEENMKKWGKTQIPKEKKLIQMYSLDGDYIKLPFKFSNDLFGKIHNDRNFKKIIVDNVPNFVLDLKPHQVESAISLLKILLSKFSVIIGFPPGYGKTILGIWLWYITGIPGCIFFHRETIGRQWCTTIKLCVPDLYDKIWFVGDRELLENEIPPLTLCMNTRYKNIPQYLIDEIGTLIVDECHLFCSPSNKDCLLYLQPKYIIMETATLQREDKMERMIYSISGNNGLFETLKTSFSVYKINTGIKAQESFTNRGIDSVKLYKSLAEDSYRNLIILNIIKNNPHRKFMVLSKLATHVDYLFKLFTENGLECDTLFRSKNSYSDSNILIGTLSKISTGFDETTNCSNFKGIKSNVLILTHSIKKWQLFTQIRGRMRYDENGPIPIFCWLSDKNNMCKRHFKSLEDCMLDMNGKIENIDFKEDSIIFP